MTSGIVHGPTEVHSVIRNERPIAFMAKAPEFTLAYEELCKLARHDPAHGPEKFVSKFVSKTAQKAGLPVYNCFTVNNLALERLHGMEEFIVQSA